MPWTYSKCIVTRELGQICAHSNFFITFAERGLWITFYSIHSHCQSSWNHDTVSGIIAFIDRALIDWLVTHFRLINNVKNVYVLNSDVKLNVEHSRFLCIKLAKSFQHFILNKINLWRNQIKFKATKTIVPNRKKNRSC